MDDTIKEAKMRSSTELENLLAISQFIKNEPDDGRHPDATGGWDIYETRFEVANTMFLGEIKIKVTNRGFVFYDITQIRRLPVNGNQTEINSAVASGNLLNNSIPETIKSVKRDFSRKDTIADQKQKQLDIINETNPAPNTYSTWIRTVDDVKTLAETLEDDDWEDEVINPDLTRTDIQNAIESGEIVVYSSYPIENGVFVSPSRMEAESYSGDGTVFEKTVDINDVAWIDPTQGQYAKVEEGQVFSRKDTDPIQAYYADVLKENRNLKNIISALDEMQYSSARNNIHLDGRDIHNIAGRLLKSVSSK